MCKRRFISSNGKLNGLDQNKPGNQDESDQDGSSQNEAHHYLIWQVSQMLESIVGVQQCRGRECGTSQMVQSLVPMYPSCDHLFAISGSMRYLHRKRCECMEEMGTGCTLILQCAYSNNQKASQHANRILKGLQRLISSQYRFAEVYLLPVHVTCMTNPSGLDTMYLSLTQNSACGSSGTNCKNGTSAILQTWCHTRNRTPFDFVKSWLQRFL